MPSKDDKLGALWFKQKGELHYFTGEISGVKVVVFQNQYKEQEKQPDWIVYKSRPKP